jgi:hypothetical protein
VNEVVYAMWDVAWGEHWFLYELGETDDGFYCRCVDADSWKTLALGRGIRQRRLLLGPLRNY